MFFASSPSTFSETGSALTLCVNVHETCDVHSCTVIRAAS